MSKKLMLLVAGALSVVAFAALPGVAAAGEPVATCGATGGVCNAEIEGTGNAILQDDSGSAAGEIKCTATGGTATATNNSSTGTGSFIFTGCTSNGFKCNSLGAGEEEIRTGSMVSHLIYLEPIEGGTTTDVGILLTLPSTGITLNCAGGLVKKTITGSVIGEVTNPNCGNASNTHTVLFAKNAAGTQRWTQKTTSEGMFDLTSGSETSDTTTSVQTGEGHIKWNAGQAVTIDC
jgi:hypothetical protein